MRLSLIPNLLTFFRFATVPVIVFALLTGHHRAAFWWALAAGISDLLDGFIARTFGWTSEWGAVWDGYADKALVIGVSLTLAVLGQFPWWLLVLAIARDAVIVGGGWYYHRNVARFEAHPSVISKINSFLFVGFVLLIMLRLGFEAGTEPMESWLPFVIAATTVASGVHYGWYYSRKAAEVRHGQGG